MLNDMTKTHLKLHAALFCVLLVFTWGCSNMNDRFEMGKDQMQKNEMKEPPLSFSLEEVIYHEGAKLYMVPQNDPYTLANFQIAYDNLSSGETTQILTRSQTDELSEKKQLEATHYALKVFPKNETEQWEIELMEDIKVSYIPFNYMQLPEDSREIVTSRSPRSEIPILLRGKPL